MRTILSRALAELNARRSVMLVTIVAEQGSAPRGPGSQMLVGVDGQLTGTIGGGQVSIYASDGLYVNGNKIG